MKHIIRKILREQEEEIITLPPFSFFGYDWEEVCDLANGAAFRIPSDLDLTLDDTEIEGLCGLVEVGGQLNLRYCENLQSLGELRSVGRWLDLRYCENLQSLGELRSVGGFLNLWHCENLQSLGELKSVDGYLDLRGCKNLKSLGKLRTVGNSLYLFNIPIAETMTDEEIRSQIDIKGRIIRK